MFDNTTYKGLAIYGTMLLAILLVPKNVLEYTYYPFLAVNMVFIVSWLFLIKFLKNGIHKEYEYQRIDYMFYDLVKIIGLPIIFYTIMFYLGFDLWKAKVVEYIYLFCLISLVLFKILLYKTKHAGMVRFSTIVLTPLINLVIINQMLTIWFIYNFMSNGYR